MSGVTYWVASRPDGAKLYSEGSVPRSTPGLPLTDIQEISQEAFAAAEATLLGSVYGPVAAASISRRQFYQQLAVQGEITQDEALAALTGTIPPELQAFVSALPAPDQFGAKMKLMADVFIKSDPLVSKFAAAKGWSQAQVDELWAAAAAL